MVVEKVCCFEGLSQSDNSRKGKGEDEMAFLWQFLQNSQGKRRVRKRFQTWRSRKMKDDNFELRHIDFEVLDINYYELEV